MEKPKHHKGSCALGYETANSELKKELFTNRNKQRELPDRYSEIYVRKTDCVKIRRYLNECVRQTRSSPKRSPYHTLHQLHVSHPFPQTERASGDVSRLDLMDRCQVSEEA